ncbi:MAG TPA: DUF1697 domain-containing protein [Gemmataceae bacterium]|jgi:uncharacterized protein (DUF1697 family)|nr:DUF1697 domain-containing protein [Gemmataceae bacterium]
MALVVFLRGVNVGGRKTFQPRALANELADFDVVNVGAAGTFVIRKAVSQAVVRAEMLRRLPVQAELMICAARDLLDLASQEPFRDQSADNGVTRYVSVLAKRPPTVPRLPISRPDGEDWQVRITGLVGRFAVSLHRRMGRTLVYPNEVVEKKLGVSATTRNWNTIAAVCAVLRDS